MKINWTEKAIKSFELNIEWLIKNWTDIEIKNFITQTEQLIDRIKQNPYFLLRIRTLNPETLTSPTVALAKAGTLNACYST